MAVLSASLRRTAARRFVNDQLRKPRDEPSATYTCASQVQAELFDKCEVSRTVDFVKLSDDGRVIAAQVNKNTIGKIACDWERMSTRDGRVFNADEFPADVFIVDLYEDATSLLRRGAVRGYENAKRLITDWAAMLSVAGKADCTVAELLADNARCKAIDLARRGNRRLKTAENKAFLG